MILLIQDVIESQQPLVVHPVRADRDEGLSLIGLFCFVALTHIVRKYLSNLCLAGPGYAGEDDERLGLKRKKVAG